MILDCDRIWTRLVTAVYTLRRLPRVTNDPPPVNGPGALEARAKPDVRGPRG